MIRWPWTRRAEVARHEVAHRLALSEADRELLRLLAAPRTVTLELGPQTVAALLLAVQRHAEGSAPPGPSGVTHAPTEDDLVREADFAAAVQVGAEELMVAARAQGHILAREDAVRQARLMLGEMMPALGTMFDEPLEGG